MAGVYYSAAETRLVVVDLSRIDALAFRWTGAPVAATAAGAAEQATVSGRVRGGSS